MGALHHKKILICGVLPPPYFGHSMMYEMLMKSSFVREFEVKFLNMHFWSYRTDQQVTAAKFFKLIKYYLQYLWLLVSFRPEFILYNISFYKMPFLKDFLFCATGTLLGGKVVIHDHGQYVAELLAALPGWQKKMLRWMLKRMSASIVMGEKVKGDYAGLADPGKLFVVPGVVEDTKTFSVEANRPSNMLNVLYFSYLSRSKGVFVAFEAAAIFLKNNRNAAIILAGPLENDQVAVALEKLQEQYPGQVRYLGYIEDANARAAIFRGADIFIFPTLRDVFGLVLLHAMAEGKPIVASREGTIPEIIKEGETGFLFEKGNAAQCAGAVERLLSDESLRTRLGAAGRRRFEEKYTLDRYAQAMGNIFREKLS
jgi:glycosyltransferase involved in cell wall biosynthesis